MKKYLLTLQLLLLLIAFGVAQNSATRNPNAQFYIQQGRNQLVNETISGNHRQAIQTWNALEKEYGKTHVILYPREQLMIALGNRNFRMFVDSARNFNAIIERNMKAYVYSDFRNALQGYILKEKEEIKNELSSSDLSEQEKDLVLVYLQFLEDEDAKSVNNNINRYKKEYKPKSYDNFFNSMKRRNLNSRINFSGGYSGEWIGGETQTSDYEQLNNLQVELDGFIRKTYLSLYIGGGFSDLTSGFFNATDNNDPADADKKKFSSQRYGFKLGRILASGNSYKLYPYLTIGGYEISKTTPEELTKEAVIADYHSTSLFAGAGMSCDIVMFRWEPRRMYDPEVYFFIRPNVGYNRFLTDDSMNNRNNFYYTVSAGLSIGPRK